VICAAVIVHRDAAEPSDDVFASVPPPAESGPIVPVSLGSDPSVEPPPVSAVVASGKEELPPSPLPLPVSDDDAVPVSLFTPPSPESVDDAPLRHPVAPSSRSGDTTLRRERRIEVFRG
jgi:hypothetical protein